MLDNSARIREIIAERDELREALTVAKEFIENQQLPDAEWSRVLDICVKALRQG